MLLAEFDAVGEGVEDIFISISAISGFVSDILSIEVVDMMPDVPNNPGYSSQVRVSPLVVRQIVFCDDRRFVQGVWFPQMGRVLSRDSKCKSMKSNEAKVG